MLRQVLKRNQKHKVKKDKNSLDSMKRKLDGYANDFAKETNTDKKNKIS